MLPRGSFCLPSRGWGGGRGVILGPFYNFSIKIMNIIKHILFVFLPRGSFCLPSRGWGGGDPFGTLLGIIYIFIYCFLLIYLFVYLFICLYLLMGWHLQGPPGDIMSLYFTCKCRSFITYLNPPKVFSAQRPRCLRQIV